MLNKCDIQVMLAGSGYRFHGGGVIRGAVHVQVNKNCRCDGLILELEWYTHGRGNRVDQTVARPVLFQGEWVAGRHHTYPFEIPCPPGPYTYHGHYLNVDWRLRARADIPWALDPKAEAGIIVVPGGAEHFIGGSGGVVPRGLAHADDDETFSLLRVVLGALLLQLALVLFYLMTEVGDVWVILLVFAIAATGAGALTLYTGIRNYLAEKRLGDIDVHLEPADISPGGTLTCRVDLEPPRTVELNHITLGLRGWERVVSGYGTNKTTYTHTVLQQEVVLDGTRDTLVDGGPATFEAAIALPPSAPCSFRARYNELEWEARVEVDVPGWPDWVYTTPLVVRPPVA